MMKSGYEAKSVNRNIHYLSSQVFVIIVMSHDIVL